MRRFAANMFVTKPFDLDRLRSRGACLCRSAPVTAFIFPDFGHSAEDRTRRRDS